MQQNPESNPTVVSRFPEPEEEQGFRGSKEVSVLLASVVLGIVTGAGVVTFKNGITAMREFTFAGPYASWLNDVAKDAVAGGLNRADINIQYAFLPLVGGVCTAIILKLLGQKDFGVPLPGQLEEVDKGIAPNVKVLFARQLAAISALGSGASLGPEGPSVEIGVSLSRVLSNALGYGTITPANPHPKRTHPSTNPVLFSPFQPTSRLPQAHSTRTHPTFRAASDADCDAVRQATSCVGYWCRPEPRLA